MLPRIAVPFPTTHDFSYNRLNMPSYQASLHAAGAEAVFFDPALSEREWRETLKVCSGALLPGSPADVNPALYGHVAEEWTADADPDRERLDRFLIEDALHGRKPLVGVCFGMQMLNVYFGGTLIQDLAPLPINHAAGESVAVAHEVVVLGGSVLADLASVPEPEPGEGAVRVSVNSSHHQAVGITGERMTVSARSQADRVVEAIEAKDARGHFVVGVQWHPERTTEISALSRNLFARLAQEAS